MAAAAAAAAVIMGTVLPFPFYYLLWNYPQAWVNLCGKGIDPSHRMAQISHVLKLIQFFSILSVTRFSWPPWYCLILFAAGQYLNFKNVQPFRACMKKNFVFQWWIELGRSASLKELGHPWEAKDESLSQAEDEHGEEGIQAPRDVLIREKLDNA